jgi:hypothetical protein
MSLRLKPFILLLLEMFRKTRRIFTKEDQKVL